MWGVDLPPIVGGSIRDDRLLSHTGYSLHSVNELRRYNATKRQNCSKWQNELVTDAHSFGVLDWLE